MAVVDPYGLTEPFERVVVYMASSSPVFYGRIAHGVEPEGLANKHCRLLLTACHQINAATGRGPAAPLIVLQRLKALHEDGKLTFADLAICGEVLDTGEDEAAGVGEDGVVTELAPIIQRRIQTEAHMRMLRDIATGGDCAKIIKMLQDSQRIGVSDTSIGTKLGSESFEHIRRLRRLPRFPTGVSSLDAELGGGLLAGTTGILIGGPGDGKSMTLSQFAAHYVRKRQLVGYVTLELSEEHVLGRIIADLCSMPINSVVGPGMERAEKIIVDKQKRGELGGFVVKYMTPHATTVEDLKTWWQEVIDRVGRPLDALFIDYADKMSAPEEKSEYQAMRRVYEGLRVWGKELDIPLWTASQSKSRGGEQRLLGLYDASDSTHKVRVVDVVVTLNVSEDKRDITLCVAKNRHGESGAVIGPLPTNFAMGRTVDTGR